MINIFVYFFFMLLSFMILFVLSVWLYVLEYSVMMEWLMISLNSLNIELMLLVDWISLLFISFIMLISSMIILYSYIYMMGHKFIKRFIFLIMLFVLSMVLMIISPNIISIMFGWDGLGVVSYCLIIFYQNYSSYNSGMVTVLCNRVGDVGLLMAISMMMIMGSWNLMLYEYNENLLIMFMLMIAAITKSAQIPFSTWLPMAMAAPTPVSALVHSSTLVTAGVYIMIRFNKLLVSSGLNNLLFFLAVTTMFMAGLMANLEVDLKKIIALSTLSQLGVMMMILSVGLEMVAFYHLLVHAIFKSMLFMCAGVIIHLMSNNQDIRLLGSLKDMLPFVMMCFFIANLALCGFPFMAGFYSKDFIMELIYSSSVNMYMLMFIMISLMFTVSYSFRLFYYMFFSEMKFYSYSNVGEEKLVNISMMILMFLSVIIGSVLNWLFFFDYYLIFLSVDIKVITYFLCLMGGTSMIVFNVKFLYKNLFMSYYLSSMWFKNYMYLWIYCPINMVGGSLFIIDKTWIEFNSVDSLFYLIKYINKNLMFKAHMNLFIFIYSLLVIYLMF
uniref:NADH dehydrogenase subunit 5 n=1 Tax=Pheidole megacephala TaxID=300850 RepID=UPI00257FEF25|nr:NADH dehydrogenase subunit 5 [Pheidole megacephala]WGV34083.1 NADH dehydrogenase subunit 5 [Pheidole megacephala]